MYFSLQPGGVNYNPKDMKFWRTLLNSDCHIIADINGRVGTNEWFLKKCGITFDRNEKDIIVGIFISDKDYTMLLLRVYE